MQTFFMPGLERYSTTVLAQHKGSNRYSSVKIMQLQKIVAAQRENNVKNEKDILPKLKHPFITSL